MAKKEEIKIPQSVFDRSNQEFRRGEQSYETGSMFTPKEARTIGLPTFPFGGRSETSLDVGSRSPSRTNPTRDFLGAPFNNPDVQYERDSQSRMANRYTMPLSDLGLNNYKSGGFRSELPTSRVGVTAYSDPYRSASIERDNALKNESSLIPSYPDVGQQGFSRTSPLTDSGASVKQILYPAGFASTILNPDQQNERAISLQKAEQAGTMPRTPEQQQALIDNIRKNAPALNQQRTDWVQDTIQKRRENPTTYKSPSGMSVAVPTNRFGEPLKAWMDQLGDSGRLNYGPRPAPQSTVTMFPSVVSSGKFEAANSFNPSESFTGSMASNYAPPTTSGFGNRTRISGGKRNASPMSEGIMSAFDLGMSVVPSYMPNFPTGLPTNNALAMGINQSAFGSGFSTIF